MSGVCQVEENESANLASANNFSFFNSPDDSKVALRNRPKPSNQICSICGDSSDGLHFGALACRACAAFFRRTVARRLKYICRFANDCQIGKSSRATCRSCRLAMCLQVGMNPRAVTSESHYQPKKGGNGNAEKIPPPAIPSRSPSRSPLPRPIPMRTEASTSSNIDISTFYSADPKMSKSSAENGTPKLRQIIYSYFADDSKLPTISLLNTMESQPILWKIMAGYERLQKRRDIGFNRVREYNGVMSRIYLEKKSIKFHPFVDRVRVEVDWLAEFLTTFEGYSQLEMDDKVVFFKRYWTIYVILERCLDTLRVLGPSPEDMRVIFANGDIVNLNTVEFDMVDIMEHPENGGYRPWFRHAHEMLPPLKRLCPDEVEMAFCLAITFWKIPPDLNAKLSPMGLEIGNQVAKRLYNEMSQHYAQLEPSPNVVERVAEMMRLIAYVEKVVMSRKEDAILAKTFKAFKIDVFLEDIFGPVEID